MCTAYRARTGGIKLDQVAGWQAHNPIHYDIRQILMCQELTNLRSPDGDNDQQDRDSVMYNIIIFIYNLLM
jgi:hypothetical protein